MKPARIDYKLTRFSSQDDSTLGCLHVAGGAPREFVCFTLEDEHRLNKVPGETRIPAGTYRILLRNEGGLNAKYAAKFDWHIGMLHLQQVPGFTWIYLHYGNTDDSTDGCILVGESARQNVTRAGFIGESVAAYERVYKQMARQINAGTEVWLTLIDLA